MTTANATYGVTIMPHTAALSGDPGTPVTYTLRVTNTGSVADTFTVTVSGNAWTTDAPASVGPLAAGVGTNVQVVAHIPSSASGGATDSATVTTRSQGDPTKSDSSTLTTSVSCVSVSGADFTYMPDAPKVGQTVAFTATVVAGTPPITYRWDFSDGGIDVGPAVIYSFPITNTSRTYTVTLTATNICGLAQAEKLVTVSPYRLYLPITLR
jgi:PKD repeat protein